jgi:DNA-binding GntR family transcriptional regulator
MSTIDVRPIPPPNYNRPVAEVGQQLNIAPVSRARLTDLAYETIRELILSGQVKMGDRLVETQLSESLGISRAPTREALQRLAAEGLVEGSAHHGVHVTVVTAQDVADLYNVRLGIESVAVRLFVAREASTAPLRAALEAMEEAAGKGELSTLVRAELDFHAQISAGSGNALVQRLFSDLEGRVLLALALDDALFEHLGDVATEHQPVLAAIESGDTAQATRALEEHIVSSVGSLLDQLEGERPIVLGAG